MGRCDVGNFIPVAYGNRWKSKLNEPLDFVYCFTVIQHLSRSITHEYLEVLSGKLATGGRMLLQFGECTEGGEFDVVAGRVYEPYGSWSKGQIEEAAGEAGLMGHKLDTEKLEEHGRKYQWHYAFLGKSGDR
jgi:cyclopropane fatty-acyl-phospholipid synthase-like methyltransferase